MRTFRARLDFSTTSPEVACEHLMLRRIGSELAVLYHDTVEAPLPAGLQALVERLDEGDEAGEASEHAEF